MNPKNLELLSRIEGFSFDEAGTSFTFAQRLARENGWPADYTRRTLREYRRFVFLAMTSPKAVCPSEAVDQAWHQHLTFTQNYWEDFCGQVLGQPLHHGPTKGGSREAEKHHDMYERTLALYRETFGEEPPADIWEPGRIRFGDGDRYVRVNRRRVWIIPKPAWLRQAAMWSLGGAPLLALQNPADGTANIFDWSGQKFLAFYLVVVGLACGVAALIRTLGRKPDGPCSDMPSDPYVASVLAGGPNLAVNAALASLAHRQLVTVSGLESISRVAGATAPPDLHPFERAVWNATSHPLASLKEVRAAVALETGAMRGLLENQKLVLPVSRQQSIARRVTWLLAAVLAMGVVKLLIGLSRARPVMFLALLLVGAGIALVIFRRVPYRSNRGEAVLRQLRTRYRLDTLRENVPTSGEDQRVYYPYASDFALTSVLPMAVGLYGLHALSDTPVGYLEHTLVVPEERRHNYSSGCSGGDTTSTTGIESGSSSHDSSSGCSSGSSGCGGCGGD